MNSRLEGRNALVTGAASGIGLACARALSAKGAQVVLADINQEAAAQQAERLRQEGHAAIDIRMDVTDRESLAEISRQLQARIGPIAILVNNAGVAFDARLGDADSPAQWDRTIAINLTGMHNVTTALLDQLKETGGAIINISSVAAFTSGFAEAGYVASKGGVRSLTQAMCRELTAFGIRANAVAPGYIRTGMAGVIVDFDEWVKFHCPMKRQGEAEEVAHVVAFLASDAASYVNGATIPVDGGYLVI